VAISDAAYLRTMWERNECPTCGKAIPVGKHAGSGRKKDGRFCSLDCYARYNAMEFAEKANLLKNMGIPPTNES
jgi:hypothetical protein